MFEVFFSSHAMANTDPYAEFFDDLLTVVTAMENENTEDHLISEDHLQHSISVLNHAIHFEFSEAECVRKLNDLVEQLRMLLLDLRRKMYNCCSSRLAILSVDEPQKEKQLSGPGRPRYIIGEEKLLYLREIGFNWKDIAAMLLVSRWTVSRRVAELGLKEVTGFSNLSDDELDHIVLEFKQQHGILVGRTIVLGHLKSLGLLVQKDRVMKSLVRIDPSNSRLRWATIIKRRKYSVAGPNSLWA